MKYLIVSVVSAVIGVCLFLHTLFSPKNWTQRELARADLTTLKAQNDALEQEIQILHRKIKAIRNHSQAQQRAVRHELGYIKPGEIVLELQPQ